ncbi:MAG: hypothetical protein ACPG7E_00645 [Marinirhabdus sp.]
MKHKNLPLLLLLALTLPAACKKESPGTFKYQEQPKELKCQRPDMPLLYEAMHSFREDLAAHFDFKELGTGTDLYYQNGYNQYIYRGSEGTFNLNQFTSPHTLTLVEKLKKADNLWVYDGEKYTLDYKADFVHCLIRNIQNKTIRNMLQTLNAHNSLAPKLMAELHRKNVNSIHQDQHYLMFIALDTYYQQLVSQQ